MSLREPTIADDHYANLRWEHGDFSIGDGPFSNEPMYGGMDSHIARNSVRRLSYKCKFCNDPICFLNRKAYDNEGLHRCLEKRSAQEVAK